MSDNRHISLTKLGDSNYSTWKGEMKAVLMRDKCWRIVKGEVTEPDHRLTTEHKEWSERFDMAAGTIYLALEPSQRVHIDTIDSDPVKMWAALETANVSKKAGARFNAFDQLFSIQKC